MDLAHVRLVFDGHVGRRRPDAEGTATIARRLVSDLFLGSPDASAPTLTVMQEAANVSSIKLVERDRSLPRRAIEDVRPEHQGRRAVPQARVVHARLERASWCAISDSKNGILVNGVRVTEQRLADGDLSRWARSSCV